MYYTNGNYSMGGNFKIKKQAPMDDRSTVAKKIDLQNPNLFDGFTYNGMIVSVVDDTINNGIYRLEDKSTLTWKKEGSDVDLTNYYTKSETYSKVETNSLVATELSSKVTKNETIVGATKTKITYDSKGLVTNGADLSASDIPSLPQSKIINLETNLSSKIDKGVGVVGATKTKITYNNNGIITGGADLVEADLPNISQSKITNLVSDLSNKQAKLVSGTNIKTINGESVLGSGNIIITGGTGGGGGGVDGLSAYELYVKNLAVGATPLDELEWLDSLKGQNGLPGRAGRDGTVEFDLLTALQKESLKGESQLTYIESGNLIRENIDGNSLIINKPLALNSFDNETFNIYGTGDNKIRIKPTNLVDRAPVDTDEFQMVKIDKRSDPFKDGSVVSRFALESDLIPSVGGGSISTLTNNKYSFKEVGGVKYLDTILATNAAYMKSSAINVGTNFTINFKFKTSNTTNTALAAILHFKNVEIFIYNGKIGYILNAGLVSTSIAPQVGRWYDVTVTVDGAVARIYVDGKLETTGGAAGAAMVVTNYIGLFSRSYDKSAPYVGGITGIRILNRAITAKEAEILYKDAPEETIVLYHGLGEVATKATVNHHTINLKAPTFKSAAAAREYGLKVGDIYIEVDTLKVLQPIP